MLITNEQLSLNEIHDLRACLPDITFDPDMDKKIPLNVLAEKYLHFYQIDFQDRYFHRWGRLILPPYTIACHYWLPNKGSTVPEKGLVMVVHGYMDHVGLYGHLIQYLLDKGYGVVAFDLPGHGLSSGERASVESFDHYVDVFELLLACVRKNFSVPISAIGQSTGGAILLKYLSAERDKNLDKVTLLAPLIEPAMWWLNKAIYALTHKRRDGVKRKFVANSGDEDFLTFLEEKDPLQSRFIPIDWLGAMKAWVAESRAMVPCNFPATIIQGKQDKTLSWRFNIRLLRKKFPRSNIIMVDESRHHMVNESKLLREKIFSQMGF